jgi:hypothetical protein
MTDTPASTTSRHSENAAQMTDKLATPAVRTEQDHYSALVQMVAELSRDHYQLRTFVYEFARVKLRRELYPRFVEGAWSEIEGQMLGLEAAIDRIEADFAKNGPSLSYNTRPALTHSSQEKPAGSLERLGSLTKTFDSDAIFARSLLLRSTMYGAPSVPVPSDAFLSKHLRSRSWRNVQILLAVAIGVAIYVATDARSVLNRVGLDFLSKPPSAAALGEIEKQREPAQAEKETTPKIADVMRTPPAAPSRWHTSDIPIPSEYGAYAAINGQLVELEQLSIKVPDPRVAISAAISNPSRTHLPTGQFQFVIFRRDLMNSAPDHVSVRIMAQVMRRLTFDSAGHAKMKGAEESWVIRNNLYQMRVAPLGDNPEMVVIRPDPPDFVFPAGRYALVLKGIGYDFTVDGSVTDAAHCIERTDSLNTPIYSECPKS